LDESNSYPATTHELDGNNLPFLTADQPGIGGTLKAIPADFVVEEIPAYEPSGSGEHLFLWIEKEDISADYLIRTLARSLGCQPGDIGLAGLKDRRAITRQYISVPAKCESQLALINEHGIRILHAARHGNKLRPGHLRGNRFEITLSGVSAAAIPSARKVAELLVERGFPNYYGEQRFGIDGETLELGLALIKGTKTARDIHPSKRRFLLKLSLSSVQSWLFNEALATRLTGGTLDMVQPGDVMEVVESGGKFVAEDVVPEQPRCTNYETVITGPMFGPKMKQPAGQVADWEAELLAKHQLHISQFANFSQLLSGTRRPYLIRPAAIDIQSNDRGLVFLFTLPSGVYATTLLRELMKSDDLAGPSVETTG
jgi:tRNA pseudouridine13 synthase